MEIERKWLLNSLPDLNWDHRYEVHQSYLSYGNPEVRIRTKKSIYDNEVFSPRMTFKSDGTIAREEIEFDISEESYNKLLNLVNGEYITKDFCIYWFDGYELEISVVDNNAFVYCEVEFDSIEDAEKFILPFSDAIEITYNSEYKMKNYWKKTRMNDKTCPSGLIE